MKMEVDTVSDSKVGVELIIEDGYPARVSVSGSSSAQGSHQAVEEALARAGWQLVNGVDLSNAIWEPGEADGEEVVFLRRADLERAENGVTPGAGQGGGGELAGGALRT